MTTTCDTIDDAGISLPVRQHRKPAEDQAALLANGWPWPEIPRQYRRAGRPPTGVVAAARSCIGYDDDRDRLPVLVIAGPVGTGKTTAACQLAAWMAAGWRWTGDAAIRYRLALRTGWIGADDVASLSSAATRILILDDLSAGLSAAGLTHALEIVETRCSWQRRTIITSSLSLDEIAALEVRHHGREIGLASRLCGGGLVAMGGPDRRAA